MIHRHLNSQRRALLPLMAALIVAGCSSERATRADTSVGATYDALAAKLKDCEHSKRTCIDASACEPAKVALCEDDVATCREAARAEADALRAAAEACRVAEDACKQLAADRAADKACHEEHHVCMRATEPAEPPCHAALRTCLEDARPTPPAPPSDETDDAEDAGVESGPGHEPPPRGPKPPKSPAPAPRPDAMAPKPPVAGTPAKPPAPAPKPRAESAAESACHEQARACMLAEMEADPAPPAHLHCPPARPPTGAQPPHAGAPGLPQPPLPAAGAAGSP